MASRQLPPRVQLGGRGVLTGRVACEASSTCVAPPGAPALPVDPVPTAQTAGSGWPFPPLLTKLLALPLPQAAALESEGTGEGSGFSPWISSPSLGWGQSPPDKRHLVLEASVSFLDWLLLTRVFYLLSLYDGLSGCLGLLWVFLF